MNMFKILFKEGKSLRVDTPEVRARKLSKRRMTYAAAKQKKNWSYDEADDYFNKSYNNRNGETKWIKDIDNQNMYVDTHSGEVLPAKEKVKPKHVKEHD